MEKTEWRKDDYLLSTDKSKIDVEAVHRFLVALLLGREYSP